MKTYLPTEKDFNAKTYLVNAEGKTLGRIATKIASILIGKHKTVFCQDKLSGDSVVVINAEKVQVTGKKRDTKMYKHYTGYPAGLKTYNFEYLMETKPEEILKRAVGRMLPKNALGKKMERRLYIYAGAEHKQQAQKPEALEV